ncbi:MAG: DUF5666 domain-containing protein [Patescibacteria group bacterium]|nr:DUF5666 domain-containing protein [Patescibacteria group bacterium]
MKNPLLITIIIALVVGAGAFLGGVQYQKSRGVGNFAAQFGNTANRRFGPNGPNGASNRAVRGQVESIDDKSLTVKLPDGSSKIVLFGTNTNFMEATSASQQNIKSGDEVSVFGTNNADGSITAQDVQIGQTMRPNVGQ